MSDNHYWYILDNAGVDCCMPFCDEEKFRAEFWLDYLSRANPARGPYTLAFLPYQKKAETTQPKVSQ
jgi:hypothetical protein